MLQYTWWTWNPDQPDAFSILYRGFNLFEASAWAVLAALVWNRWYRNRASPAEILYAVAFLFFGWTDWLESSASSVWLMLVKAITLVALLRLRTFVMSSYPAARIF